MTRIGIAIGVRQALRRLELDTSEMLPESGFDSEIFDDLDNLTSIVARNELIRYCATKAKSEHSGLLLGQQVGLSSLGLVGLLMRYSDDLGAALKNLVAGFVAVFRQASECRPSSLSGGPGEPALAHSRSVAAPGHQIAVAHFPRVPGQGSRRVRSATNHGACCHAAG